MATAIAREPETLATSFRQAMRRLTASIVIVTGCNDGEPFGMAATACTSVSADPPSIVVGVNQSASLHGPIEKGGRFAVNLLGREHQDIVAGFSDSARRTERFASERWGAFDCGVPLLADSVMSILAEVDVAVPYGSHTLFIGRVLDIRLGESVEPLLWHDGKFALAAPQVALPAG